MSMMAMLMGFLAALGWGAADYLAGSAARLAGTRRAALFTQSVGWIALSLLLLAMPALREKGSSAPWSGWGYGLLAAGFNLAGSLALLRAFSLGRASLIAPLITSYAAVTAILGFATGGDALNGSRLVGIVICLVGAPMAAVSSGDRGPLGSEGVGYALVTALCFGFGFWMQGRLAVPAIGAAPMLWLFFGAGILLLAPMLAVHREALWPPRIALPLLLFQSLCNLLGYATFAIGMTTGAVTIVTVLSTFAAAVTALLGFFLRKERLTHVQGFGVFAILAGATMLRN